MSEFGRSVLTVVCLIGTICAQERPAFELEAELKRLRSGGWTADRAEEVIGALVERGRQRAAGWWVREVRSTIEDGRLPDRLRRRLDSLEKARLRIDPDDPEAARLAWEVVNHVRILAGRGQGASARELLPLARAMAEAWPEAKTLRLLERTTRRVERAGPKNRGDLPERYLGETERLTEQAREKLGTWFELATEEYEKLGCPAGRAHIREVVEVVWGPPDEREARARLILLRKAARELGPVQTLTLWVAGECNRISASLDGEALPDTGGSSGFAAERPRELSVVVASGDLVLLCPHGGRGSDGRKGDAGEWINPILAVHARLGGRELDHASWFCIERKDMHRLEPPLKRVSTGRRNEREGVEVMEFALPSQGEFIYLPYNYLEPLETAVADGAGDRPILIIGFAERAVYALKVP